MPVCIANYSNVLINPERDIKDIVFDSFDYKSKVNCFSNTSISDNVAYNLYKMIDTCIYSKTYDNNLLEGNTESSGDMEYSLSKIETNNRTFVLNSTIYYSIEFINGYYTIDYKHLDMLVYEESKEEVIKSFQFEFSMLWDLYAKESDDNLTYDAILLKERLLQMVKEVK